MARVQPGWIADDTGNFRYWDGQNFGSESPPDNNPGSPRGWYRHSPQLQRWWNGYLWSEALLADNGGVSVGHKIGQAIIQVPLIVGDVENRMREVLRIWPPCKIVSLSAYVSTVAAATNIVAVLDWSDGGRALS